MREHAWDAEFYADRASRPLAYTGVLSAGNLMLIAPPIDGDDVSDHLMEVVQRMMRRGSPTK